MIHTFFDGTKVNIKEVNMLSLKIPLFDHFGSKLSQRLHDSKIMVSVGSHVVWLKPNIKEIYTSLEKPDYKPSKDDCINVMKSYINGFGLYEVIIKEYDLIKEISYINLENLLIVMANERDNSELTELYFKSGKGYFELPYNEGFLKAWAEKHSEKPFPECLDYGIY